MESQSSKLTLSDGRELGYAEYGSATGVPILYFHGSPSSRLEGALGSPIACSHNVRLVAIDRPGFGLSTFQPNRQFLDWPEDVLELADHLKVRQFRIFGGSGGSPYVLACAKEIPRSRLLAAAIIGGIYPNELGTEGMLTGNRILFYLSGSWMSPILKPLIDWQFGNLARDPDPEVFKKAFLKEMSGRPESDQKPLENERWRNYLIESCRESFTQGSDAFVQELKLYGRPWDFELEDVQFDGLIIWHGGLDVNVPVGMMKRAVEKLKGSKSKIFDEETHLSLPYNHLEDILKCLLESGS